MMFKKFLYLLFKVEKIQNKVWFFFYQKLMFILPPLTFKLPNALSVSGRSLPLFLSPNFRRSQLPHAVYAWGFCHQLSDVVQKALLPQAIYVWLFSNAFLKWLPSFPQKFSNQRNYFPNSIQCNKFHVEIWL